jgi:hypothetical protein
VVAAVPNQNAAGCGNVIAFNDDLLLGRCCLIRLSTCPRLATAKKRNMNPTIRTIGAATSIR